MAPVEVGDAGGQYLPWGKGAGLAVSELRELRQLREEPQCFDGQEEGHLCFYATEEKNWLFTQKN